jgi:hypothetical protein
MGSLNFRETLALTEDEEAVEKVTERLYTSDKGKEKDIWTALGARPIEGGCGGGRRDGEAGDWWGRRWDK